MPHLQRPCRDAALTTHTSIQSCSSSVVGERLLQVCRVGFQACDGARGHAVDAPRFTTACAPAHLHHAVTEKPSCRPSCALKVLKHRPTTVLAAAAGYKPLHCGLNLHHGAPRYSCASSGQSCAFWRLGLAHELLCTPGSAGGSTADRLLCWNHLHLRKGHRRPHQPVLHVVGAATMTVSGLLQLRSYL